MHLLIQALLNGQRAEAVCRAKELLESGVDREKIVVDGLEEAMTRLDGKCTLEQFNLLEIMLVGRAATAVLKEIYPDGQPPRDTRGTVVIAALEGDIHDIGKNIVGMVLATKGIRVIDRGTDCSVDQVVAVAEREQAMAIMISGLITTVIPQVRTIKELLNRKGLTHIRVLAGGAALKQSTARSLGVDYVAGTVFDGVHYLERLGEDKLTP